MQNQDNFYNYNQGDLSNGFELAEHCDCITYDEKGIFVEVNKEVLIDSMRKVDWSEDKAVTVTDAVTIQLISDLEQFDAIQRCDYAVSLVISNNYR